MSCHLSFCSLTALISFHFLYEKKRPEHTPIFLKNVFTEESLSYKIWDDLRVSKWSQNCHFWLNNTFKTSTSIIIEVLWKFLRKVPSKNTKVIRLVWEIDHCEEYCWSCEMFYFSRYSRELWILIVFVWMCWWSTLTHILCKALWLLLSRAYYFSKINQPLIAYNPSNESSHDKLKNLSYPDRTHTSTSHTTTTHFSGWSANGTHL